MLSNAPLTSGAQNDTQCVPEIKRSERWCSKIFVEINRIQNEVSICRKKRTIRYFSILLVEAVTTPLSEVDSLMFAKDVKN